MKIIPVMDLMAGQVVRAKMGARHLYRPIETCLASTPDPVDLMQGLMDLAQFRVVYIADIDAITGRGDNTSSIVRLKALFPHITFWIDNGSCTSDDIYKINPLGEVVIGSESQKDLRLLLSFPNTILSLDFGGGLLMGSVNLLEHADIWPDRIIAMALSHVGSDSGPDMNLLEIVKKLAKSRAVYAAGGVRGEDDLDTLERAGAAGALVASVLHDGRLSKKYLSQNV